MKELRLPGIPSEQGVVAGHRPNRSLAVLPNDWSRSPNFIDQNRQLWIVPVHHCQHHARGEVVLRRQIITQWAKVWAFPDELNTQAMPTEGNVLRESTDLSTEIRPTRVRGWKVPRGGRQTGHFQSMEAAADGSLFATVRPLLRLDLIESRNRTLSPFLSKIWRWWAGRSRCAAVIRSPWNTIPHAAIARLPMINRLDRS